MTREERTKPSLVNGSRRQRIAVGSGTTISDVNMLLKQFEEMQKMMKQMSGIPGMKRRMNKKKKKRK
jgi:signal recognition particle subunit SRP54